MLRAFAFALCMAPLPALAFSTQGFEWPNTDTPVHYMIHPTGAPNIAGDAEAVAIRRAFATWQTVACSYLKFEEKPWADPRAIASDGGNRIFWSADNGEWPADQQGTLALTFTFYDTGNNQIKDADMVLNAVYWEWTTTEADIGPRKVDVETVVLHEVGHFFGLNHSQDPGAAMFPSNNKGIQRAPASDDINGVCALYSNGQAPPTGSDPTKPGATGSGAVGAPCQANTDCVSLICAEDKLINKNYCTAPCTPAEGSCPSGLMCVQVQDGKSFCLAPAPVDELCDQCNSSNQCATGLCMNVPGQNFYQPFCTRACDPTPGAASCPSGYRCDATAGLLQSGGICVPVSGVCDPKGRGGHNEPCYSNETCKPNHVCTEYFPGSKLFFCYAACPASAIGESCTLNTPGFICGGVRGKPNVGACYNMVRVGAPCLPEVCETGAECLFDENQGVNTAVCYKLCATQGQCPANTACELIESLGTGVCTPRAGFKYLSQDCLSDEECESKLCRTYGASQLCTKACTTGDENSCDPGLKCIPSGDVVAGFCWPKSYDDKSTDALRQIERHGGTGQPVDFCSCDITRQCDSGCECDPECGGGCGCTATGEGSAAWSALLLMALVLRSQRRHKKSH